MNGQVNQQEDEFSWLNSIPSLTEPHREEEREELDWLNQIPDLQPVAEPEPEKPNLIDRLKSLFGKAIPSLATLTPETAKIFFAGAGKPKPEEIPEAPREITIGAMKPEEKKYFEEEAVVEAAERFKPGKYAEGDPIFKDPKVNYYAEKIAQRLPLWLTAFAGAPAIIGIFELMNQTKNVVVSLAKKEKYDPVASRWLSELIPEDAPGWFKTTAPIGEGAADMILAAIAAKKISYKAFQHNYKRVLNRLGEIGWPKDLVGAYSKAFEDCAGDISKFRTLEEEIGTLIKSTKWMRSPTGRMIGELVEKPPARPEIKPAGIPERVTPRLMQPAKYVVTEKGAVVPAATPEEELLKIGYRGAEGAPLTTQATINIKPREDGSVDINIQKPTLEAPEREIPTEGIFKPEAPDEFLEKTPADWQEEFYVLRENYENKYLNPLKEEIETLKTDFDAAPQRSKQRKAIKESLEETKAELSEYERRWENEQFESNMEQRRGLEAIIKRQYEVEDDDLVEVLDDFFMNITERPGIEHYWNLPIKTALSDVITAAEGEGVLKTRGVTRPEIPKKEIEIPSKKPTIPPTRLSKQPLINWIRKEYGSIELDSFEKAGLSKGEAQSIIESPQKYIITKTPGKGGKIELIAEKAKELGYIETEDPAALVEAINDEIAGKARPAREEIDTYLEAKEREWQKGLKEVTEQEYEAWKLEQEELRRGEIPKAEQKKLVEVERPERKYPVGFDERGMTTFRDLNKWRYMIQSELDDGWVIEYGHKLGRQGWGRIVSKREPGKGELIPAKTTKEEALKKKPVQLGIDEEVSGKLFVKEEPGKFLTQKDIEAILGKAKGRELTPEEIETLEKAGVKFEKRKAPKETELPEPEIEKVVKEEKLDLIKVSVKTPDGKTEYLGEITADRIKNIRNHARKLGVENKLEVGKIFKGKWKEKFSPIEQEKHMKDVIRDVKEKPAEVWKAWEEEGPKEIRRVEEKEAKYEASSKFDPDDIDNLPFDGAVKADKADLFGRAADRNMAKVAKAHNMIGNLISKTKFHKPNTIRNAFEAAGLEVPDELMIKAEIVYADKIASTARGYVDKYIERMRDAGVREEVIKSTKVADKYQITKLIKVKREPKTKEVSAVIYKSLIDYIRDNYKGKGGEGWIKKFSAKYLAKQTTNILKGFEVPQVFFSRLGLKEIIYDPIRAGERNAEVLRREVRMELKSIFKELSKRERKELFHYFSGKQGKEADIKKAGIKVVKFSDLNAEQKKAVVGWRGFHKRYKDRVLSLARNHGIDIEFIENYFPMYGRKDYIRIEGRPAYMDIIRKDPFFKSLLEREEKVPYDIYEHDAYKNALAYGQGMSNFLEIGKKTLPIKYLIDSNEFKEIVGRENHKAIVDWFRAVVNPPVGSGFWRFFRRCGYRTFLGLNPIVVAKQGISYLDVVIVEKVPAKISPRYKRIIKRLEKPSVTERLPEISVADIRSKADKFLLSGMIYADRAFARGALGKVLAAELKVMEGEGIELSNKSLREALRRVSDRIDLAMAGVTPAQRPPFYRTELGKLALMFTSTINSRFQYYIKNAAKGIGNKDAWLIAKVITAFFLGGFIEAALKNLALNWGDTKEMLKDTLIATGGNIPVLGGLFFALQVGDWHISPVFSNIEEGLKAAGRFMERPEEREAVRALFGAAEILGLPKQVRKTYEGIVAIEKGKKVSGKKVIEITSPIEQFRAVMRGQFAPLEVQEYYRLRDLKTSYHRKIAGIFSGVKNEKIRSTFQKIKPSVFRRNFWYFAKKYLTKSDVEELREIIRKAKEQEIKLNMTSIVSYLREKVE